MKKEKNARRPIWASHTEAPPPTKPKAFSWKDYNSRATWILLGAWLLGIAVIKLLEIELLRHLLVVWIRSLPVLPLLFLTGILLIWALWKIPIWQVAQSKALNDENRFDRENEARKTLAQILAGVFVLAGLYSSVQTLNVSREGQITDRFTKAIEQLGALDGNSHPKLEVRLGAIYALERISRDSEKDYPTVMEVLAAYVRENSRLENVGKKIRKAIYTPTGKVEVETDMPLSTDVQAVLTVIGRRERKYDTQILELDKAYLAHVSLAGANLSHVSFGDAYLRKASLLDANLRRAFLTGADLSGADLEWADLSEATLIGTDLRGADLRNAQSLTQEQIDSARGDAQTKLPSNLNLTRPSEWSK